MTAAQLVWTRLREVEVHHADLAAGNGPGDWLPGFVAGELAIRLAGLATRLPVGTAVRVVASDTGAVWEVGDGPASLSVTGPSAAVLAWLLGRDSGHALTAPAGLPLLGPW